MKVQIIYEDSLLNVYFTDRDGIEIQEIESESGDKITTLIFELMSDEKYRNFRERVIAMAWEDRILGADGEDMKRAA